MNVQVSGCPTSITPASAREILVTLSGTPLISAPTRRLSAITVPTTFLMSPDCFDVKGCASTTRRSSGGTTSDLVGGERQRLPERRLRDARAEGSLAMPPASLSDAARKPLRVSVPKYPDCVEHFLAEQGTRRDVLVPEAQDVRDDKPWVWVCNPGWTERLTANDG